MTQWGLQLLDLTYPITSMFSGRQFNQTIRGTFGDVHIEDLCKWDTFLRYLNQSIINYISRDSIFYIDHRYNSELCQDSYTWYQYWLLFFKQNFWKLLFHFLFCSCSEFNFYKRKEIFWIHFIVLFSELRTNFNNEIAFFW